MAKPYVISPESKLMFEIPPFKGRLRISLDSEDLFEASNNDVNSAPLFRVLELGDHRLDISAYDHGNTKHDVTVNLTIQERDSTPLLTTQYRLMSSSPEDTVNGKSIHLKVRSN